MYLQAICDNQSLSNGFYQQILFNIFQKVQNIDIYIENGQLKMLLTFSRFYDDTTIYTIIQLFNQYLKINYNNKEKLTRFHTIIVESNFLNWILKPLMERYFSYLPDRHNLTTIIEFFIYNLKYCNVPQIMETLLSIKPLVLIAAGEFDHDQFLSSLISDLNLVNKPNEENLSKKTKKSEKVKFKKCSNKYHEKSERSQASSSTFREKSERSQASSSTFREISITPILDDISGTEEDANIRINKFNTDENTYKNVDDYLDLHFRLLRENFMRQLRSNFCTIKSHGLLEKRPNVRIFEDVSIESLCVPSHKFSYRIKFNKSKSNNDVDWNEEKCFMFGSLVILTNNLHDTIYTASVVHRNLDNSGAGYLVVNFNDQNPINDVINKTKFSLFESHSPFETYKHVLMKLKEFREGHFPFKENIVYGQTLITTPKYLKCGDVKEIKKLSYKTDNFDLDESQFDAFKSALLSNVSLIQGPPASGKTFVALKLISYLSENFQNNNKLRNLGPILFVCNSDQKLDQFLTEIIDVTDSNNILRIGGQTRNLEMENCSLQKIKKNWIVERKIPGEIRREYMYLTTKMRKLEDKLREIYSQLTECDFDKLSFDTFNVVIKTEHKQYFRSINYDEWLGNYEIPEGTAAEELDCDNIGNLCFLTEEDRWKVHKYWSMKYRQRILNEFENLKIKHDKLVKQYEYLESREDALLMLKMNVIGMTLAKAVQYGEVLEQVGCRIVIMDDAAEVLESQTITALSPSCEQLILIGDHIQLRPKVVEIELEKSYKLAISLFERLVANGWPCRVLKYQQRMRPEIADCLKCVYPKMENHYKSSSYGDVRGMGTNMYWFNHNETLTRNSDENYSNDYEALFIRNLCQYLIDLGNSPNEITIITFFLDQLNTITKLIKDDDQCRGLTVFNIDDCKCKENDIVIISFAQSDPIGLLKSPNHLCYALSRAKRGLYLFGNFQLLRTNIPLLTDILSNDIGKASFGSKLPLKCPQHPDNENYYAANPDDLLLKSCGEACGIELKCTHKCTKPCHWSNIDHENYVCNEITVKQCPRKLHTSSVQCWESVFCQETISVTWPKCQHKMDMPCYRDEISYLAAELCVTNCEKLLICGHRCQKKCYENCLCTKLVLKKLKCGHVIEMECGARIRRPLICKEIVQINLKCGHKLTVECKDRKPDEDDYECKYICPVKLTCGHVCRGRCGDCLPNLKFHRKCKRPCEGILHCGHKCDKICHFGVDCPKYIKLCTKLCQKMIKIDKAICNGTAAQQLSIDYTADLETLLDRVINTSDIVKEFKWTSLTTEQKLKELMKLILICHPDKNNSNKATKASQKLLEKKRNLEAQK